MGFVESDDFRKAHFSLKHRLVSSLSNRLHWVTYRSRRGLTKGLKRRGGLGFLPAFIAGGQDDTAEYRFFSGLDLKGRVVYDVGSFQGLMTLFFSSRADRVVAYEPNPMNRKRLEENLALNEMRNVVVRDVAVGDAPGELTIVWDPLMAGAGSADEAYSKQIVESSPRFEKARALCVRLDDDVRDQGLPAPDFIKIDVEGFELQVLKGAEATLESHSPQLYLEMHGLSWAEKREKVTAIVEFLTQRGYDDIRHVESTQRVTPATAGEIAAEGHLYCNKTEAQ